MIPEHTENLEDIPVVDAKSKFDYTVYEGQRVKIATVELKMVPNLYPNGAYDATSKEMKKVVEITTAPLRDIDIDDDGNTTLLNTLVTYINKEGNETHLTVRERFNLQIDNEGKYVISKHPKATLWKFMRKIGANTLPEIKDKIVTITTKPSKKENDETRYLAIVTA